MSVIARANARPRVKMQPNRLRVSVAATMDAVASAWDALAGSSRGSVYQSRGFLTSWIAHVAPAVGVAPQIVFGVEPAQTVT